MKKILFSSVALAFLIGCGGGGGSNDSNTATSSDVSEVQSSSTQDSQTKTGTFEDAPVSGLYYETSSGIKGFTDENGSFKYKEGDSVTFKIGNVLIGKVESGSLVTPYTFGDKAEDIAYVLQNLDTDGNVGNSIQLPKAKVLKETFYGSDFDTMKSKLSDIKTEIKNSNSNVHFPDIDENKALSNMNNYLANKTKDPFLKDVLKNGMSGLKNKTFYVSKQDDFTGGDVGTVKFNDDNLLIKSDSGETFKAEILESNKDYFRIKWSAGDEEKLSLLKIVNNLIFIKKDNEGILILSSSKKAVENYEKELEKKYSKTAIDPKTLKGKYLYGMDDDKYQWRAVKLGDEIANMYIIDDIFDIDDLNNTDKYIDAGSENIQYPGGNKIENYDEGEWETYDVYKYSLADKDVNVYVLGGAFDSLNLFSQRFTRFNIDTIHFTKGNAYCNLIWDECWIDGDAIKELDSNIENIPAMYSIKKGEAKTPKYSNVSEYLKNGYYRVYTDDSSVGYEEDYLKDDKYCYTEMASSTGDTDSGCEESVTSEVLNKATKIVAEYDNGVLVDVSHDGKHFQWFLYNNEEDAKKVYQTLLPKYLNPSSDVSEVQSSNTQNAQTKTGTFEDAPVSGIYYETSSGIKGFTDKNGNFKYNEGDTITFKIGNVLIGEVESGSLITPYAFGDKAEDIAYILQNLDTDGDISNNIQLPDENVLKQIVINSNLSLMKSDLSNIKAKIQSTTNANFPDIDENKALSNMNNYLASKTNDPFIKDVLENGMLGLKNKTFYFLNQEDFIGEDIKTITFTDYNLFIKSDSGESFIAEILESNKDYFRMEWPDGNREQLRLLKIIDNLIFLKVNEAIFILSSSKEAVENYKKELEKKYPKTAVDPKTLKGKYLYGIDDDKYQWRAVKLGDEIAKIYKMDDIFSLDDEDNYIYAWNENIQYPGGNKFKYFYKGNWKQDEVYKIPLANKDVNVYMLGAAFDANKVFPQKFTRFGIDTIHFTKGNAYCNLIENKCWIDGDALKELDSAWNNVNYSYANMRGEAKTPKYSKISDYLKDKNQNYYSVYTEDGYIDYDHDWWDSKKGFCNQELQSNGHLDEICAGNINNAVKILKEYDNGILVEFNYNGIHSKTFSYNNEDDAKKVYQTLLPKYSN